MHMFINARRGFTLIELLVVVLIIGILAAVAVPQYTFAVEKARLSEAMTIMSSLEKAIDVWMLEHGTPTQDIVYFLGDNANGNGQLNIDLADMDCSVGGGTECASKHFQYMGACSFTGSCYITIFRYNGGDSLYSVTVQRNSKGIWRGDECDYYPDLSPVGGKICKMLEAQGNGYYACEDC